MFNQIASILIATLMLGSGKVFTQTTKGETEIMDISHGCTITTVLSNGEIQELAGQAHTEFITILKQASNEARANHAPRRERVVHVTTSTNVKNTQPGTNEERVCKLIDDVCADMEFENTALIKAMVRCESNFDTTCVSSCNAQGLMQITPRWFGELMKEYGVTDLCADEEGNLRIGIHWIRHLINKYDGDLHKALVAYNCGESVVDQKGRTSSSYSEKVILMAGDYT